METFEFSLDQKSLELETVVKQSTIRVKGKKNLYIIQVSNNRYGGPPTQSEMDDVRNAINDALFNSESTGIVLTTQNIKIDKLTL